MGVCQHVTEVLPRGRIERDCYCFCCTYLNGLKFLKTMRTYYFHQNNKALFKS